MIPKARHMGRADKCKQEGGMMNILILGFNRCCLSRSGDMYIIIGVRIDIGIGVGSSDGIHRLGARALG